MPDTELTIEPGKHNLVITRVFDAPRDLVFKTVTDSSLIPQWWGQSNLTTTVEKMEVKPGGVWRYVQRDPAGNEFAFNGVYHAVVPPELLIYTFGSSQESVGRIREFSGRASHFEAVVRIWTSPPIMGISKPRGSFGPRAAGEGLYELELWHGFSGVKTARKWLRQGNYRTGGTHRFL